MLFLRQSPAQLASISLLASLIHHASAASISTAYCSSQNTGDGVKTTTSIYQSQGLCSTFCSGYAYGILLAKVCWCSNYAPAVTSDTSDCSDACPGYPSDTCGNSADSLYEYLDLGVAASGTQGVTSSTAEASSSNPGVTVTDTPPPVTIFVTTTPSPVASSTASTIVPSSTTATSTTAATGASSTTFTTSTTASADATTTAGSSATPVVSLKTVGGGVETIYITPSNTAASETLTANRKAGGQPALNGGQAAGLSIGLIALLAVVAGILFFCWRKRKQDKAMSEYGGISRQGSTLVKSSAQVPSRSMSENSRYVLATDGRAIYPAWETDDEPGSRTSRLVPIDPRLDPAAAIYQQNGGLRRSRDSVNTINDGRDYSRRVAAKPVLRVMNQDPE